MGRPPTDVAPSALFLKLCESPAPSEVVEFPRRLPDGSREKIRIQVLPHSEHNRLRLVAQQWITSQKISPDEMRGPAAMEVLGDRVAQELLAAACVSVDPIEGSEATGKPRYVRLFRGADDLAQFTADEIHALFWSYEMIREKYAPSPETLTEEDVTDWIKRLAEGASEFPLSAFTWRRLVELSMSLAERAYTLSAILASQSSTLPPTLASNLERWGIGTTSFGLRHADAGILSGSELDHGPDDAPAPEQPAEASATAPRPVPEEITPERAAQLAKLLTGHGVEGP